MSNAAELFEHIEQRWSEDTWKTLISDLEYNAVELHTLAIHRRGDAEQQEADALLEVIRKTVAQLEAWKAARP